MPVINTFKIRMISDKHKKRSHSNTLVLQKMENTVHKIQTYTYPARRTGRDKFEDFDDIIYFDSVKRRGCGHMSDNREITESQAMRKSERERERIKRHGKNRQIPSKYIAASLYSIMLR